MKVPYYSSYEQTVKLNTLLHKSKKFYEMGDVFNYLPHCICFNGRKGYLTITKIDIYWTSLELGYQGSVIGLFQHITSNRNIFDSFIDALQWIRNDSVKIIEQ